VPIDKRLAKYECRSCSSIIELEGGPAFDSNNKYMGPCRWNVNCECGSMYFNWLNYEEFALGGK